MKIGLIGAGGWGRNLARTLHTLGFLGGIAEVRSELRAELSGLYPDVPLYSDHHALLQSGLPAVAIATPAVTHCEVAKAALNAGKDVFVEKPLAMTATEGSELTRLAAQDDRVLMVGHLLLYQPAVQWIWEHLKGGRLGQLWGLHHERLNLGRVRSAENALWSLGVHDVAVTLHLVGRSPSGTVAVGQAILQPGVEDDVRLHLRFSKDVWSHIHVSWLWPERRRRLTVVGSVGMLVYDEADQTVMLHKKGITEALANRDDGSEVVFQGAGEPLKLELEHFLDCVNNRTTPRTDGESAVEVLKVLEAATAQMGNS
jgi:predicted dehydrogenase